jgi:hypothetical protein
MAAGTRRSKKELRDFTVADRDLKAGKTISAEDLASLLDRNRGLPIPNLIVERIIVLLRRHGRRGRKPVSKAGLAWSLDRSIFLYDRKLRQLRREDADKRLKAQAARRILPTAETPAHERAAIYVLERMPDEFLNISAKRLINLMSEYKRGKNPADYMIPPDEFDPPDHVPAPPPGSPLIPIDAQVIDVPAKR